MFRICASQINELISDLRALQSASSADVTPETLTQYEIAMVVEARRKRLLLRLENRGLTIADYPEPEPAAEDRAE